MARIELMDSGEDIVVKMADGNMGAVACLMSLIQNEKEIDPDAAFAPMSTILDLDSFGIYGTAIYVLWSDKCGKDTRKLVMLVRACQLGFLKREMLVKLSEDQDRRIDFTAELDELDAKVCERLPKFRKPAAIEASVLGG